MIISNIDTGKKVFIIAEIGNNHEGNIDLAREMIHAAKETGADAVKFQTFRTEHYVLRAETERFAKLKSFELSYDQFAELAELANKTGILFMSTPFDIYSARFLNSIVPAFKIASGDNTFYPLLQTVAAFGKPIILSTGFSDVALIAKAKNVIEAVWKEHNVDPGLALLHCVSNYPALPEEMNMLALKVFEKEFSCTVGFSDHTLGLSAAVLSVALGARVVEKHFTLDKNYSDFRDHKVSADPGEMKNYVAAIREAEVLLGKEQKVVQKSEAAILTKVRRVIMTNADIKSGEVITNDNISWVRGEGDFPAGNENEVVGKTAATDLPLGVPFKKEHVR